MENTRRMTKRRKSLSPSGESESVAESLSRPGGGVCGARLPLQPICSGYSHTTSGQEATHGAEKRERGPGTESLPLLCGEASSPPQQGRLRRGSLVGSVGRTGSHTDCDMVGPRTSVYCDMVGPRISVYCDMVDPRTSVYIIARHCLGGFYVI